MCRSQPGVEVGHLVGLDVGTDDLHLKKEGSQRVDCPGSILNLVTQADAVVKTFQLEKKLQKFEQSINDESFGNQLAIVLLQENFYSCLMSVS